MEGNPETIEAYFDLFWQWKATSASLMMMGPKFGYFFTSRSRLAAALANIIENRFARETGLEFQESKFRAKISGMAENEAENMQKECFLTFGQNSGDIYVTVQAGQLADASMD